jgi:DNA-binding transcriptional ArsR family regulator
VLSFAALADDTRLEIVEVLAEGDRTAGELVDLFDISQPAVSRHLRVLREAGVVSATAAGRERLYRLNVAAVAAVGEWATTMTRTWEQRFDALGIHLDQMKEQRRGG